MATVHTLALPLDRPGVAAHKRATVTGAAGTLGSFLAGGTLPTKSGRLPNYVFIQAEPTNSATVSLTCDGSQSTPSATLGIQLVPGGSWEAASSGPFAETDIMVYAFSTTQYLQCRFYWLEKA